MMLSLIVIVWGIFGAMLFLNIYFRVKVFKSYKRLVQQKVEFGAVHIFNRDRLEKEVIQRYPQAKADIEQFVNHLRYSIRMATVLMVLITLFGGILMYYR